jgi:hypothetical protein
MPLVLLIPMRLQRMQSEGGIYRGGKLRGSRLFISVSPCPSEGQERSEKNWTYGWNRLQGPNLQSSYVRERHQRAHQGAVWHVMRG